MPTYQYVCTECGDQLEAVQKFTDEPLTVHEACGGRLRKVFSAVGVVFKGSGFYRTDSRKEKEPSSSSSSSDSSSDSSSKSSSSSSESSKSSGSSDSSGGKTASSSSASSGEKVA